jgi:hypothetical protein
MHRRAVIFKSKINIYCEDNKGRLKGKENTGYTQLPLRYGHKKWQVTYIAPLNHLPLLPSGPGGVQQELVV